MKPKTRYISLILTVIFLLSFAACSANGSSYDNTYPGNYYPEQFYSRIYAGKPDLERIPTNSDKPSVYPPQTVFIENRFISTQENPISTFSADVDTASYSYFRKLVKAGYNLNDLIINTGNDIRTEDMINYFKYNYKGPNVGELFGVNALISGCPWNDEALLMTLGFKAKDIDTKTSNNLVFLIDVSGSMNADDKLPLLKETFYYLLENLTENDIISIVTYSGKEEVVLEGCEGHLTKKILDAIESLRASGSTNGEAGIQKAYDIAKKYFIEGGNNRVILASDGDLNVGISTPEQLKDFISQKRNTGVYLSVLGFGTGNYRNSTMEALAQNGNGVYYYIDSAAEAKKVFGDDLLGTLYTVGTDVKLQITFDPAYVKEYRLIGYETRILSSEDFSNDAKDAGDVGSGHSLTVCYELKLTAEGINSIDSSASPPVQWMTLAVRYKAPGESTSRLCEYPIGSGDYGEQTDEFRFICAVIKMAMILHKSEYLDSHDINGVLEILESIDIPLNDEYRQEFKALVKALSE